MKKSFKTAGPEQILSFIYIQPGEQSDKLLFGVRYSSTLCISHLQPRPHEGRGIAGILIFPPYAKPR